MTGYLAIRKSVYDAQSAVRKLGFSVLGDAGEVELAGQGGVMNKGTADFYVHGDTRWGAKQICAIGAYAANVASLDDAIADLIAEPVAGERYRVLRGFVFGWLVGRNAIVWPESRQPRWPGWSCPSPSHHRSAHGQRSPRTAHPQP